MLRSHDLSLYHDFSYRSPASTPNGGGIFSAKVEVSQYGLKAADDRIGRDLDKALSHVTSLLADVEAAVVGGPIGGEVKRLQAQLTAAVASQNDLAARVSDLQRKRAEALRAGKPASPERIREAKAAHVAAGELVSELTGLLDDAETRLDEQKRAARIEAIQRATATATADLEASERAAALVIAEALATIYVTSSVLRELDRQFNATRSPRPAPLPPINVPAVTNHQSPRLAEDDLGILGPVEILS